MLLLQDFKLGWWALRKSNRSCPSWFFHIEYSNRSFWWDFPNCECSPVPPTAWLAWLPQRCELKINKWKIKTSFDIESCVDCNYNIRIKNGSCEIGATSRYKICVSQSSGCGFWSRFRWTVLAISAFESWYLGLLILVLSIVGSYFVVLHLIVSVNTKAFFDWFFENVVDLLLCFENGSSILFDCYLKPVMIVSDFDHLYWDILNLYLRFYLLIW